MLDRYFPLYITVFLISMLLTIVLEKKLIPALTQRAKQPIYEEGPKWHLKKSGTPTMGGVAFLIANSISLLVCFIILLTTKSNESVISILICHTFAVLNACVGVIDDLIKLKMHHNRGISAKAKLASQFLLSILFLLARSYFLDDSGVISFSFGEVDLGFLYYPIALIILLGVINCANLTDGIDGLASSVAFSIGISLLYISAALNTEVGIMSAAIIGSTVGFLVFNLHPAKIFMGDTGSLYFGALIASLSFALNNPFLIIFIAGVYVLEGCSVILQVIWFKLFGKRIFKMAPFHHHLEQCGWSENRICIVAILSTFIFSIPAYIFYLP